MNSRELSNAEQALFVAYVNKLREAGITYVLLRNYIGFPATIGHDLDVFIRRRELAKADSIFRELLATSGGRIVIVHQRDYFTDIRFCVDDHPRRALHLDLYHGSFTWHSLHYLGEEELLANTRTYEGHAIPRPAHEALNIFLASILWGGFFKTRYQPRIAALLSEPEEKSVFYACLARTFGAVGVPPFDPCSPDFPTSSVVKAYAKRLRRAFKWRSFCRRPLQTIACLARHWRTEFSHVLRPKGLFIAILGPDGAGKSTVLDGLVSRIRELFGELQRHHWRPGILPEIGVLLGKRTAEKKPVTDPHGKPPHSLPAAFFRLAYYWLDYWLGWLPRLRKRRAQVHLVLFDRYADDWWCDPRRYRFALPQWLLRLAARTVPQPDFTFVLLADATTIATRKAELPAENLQPILDRYRVLAESGPRHFGVNASQSPEAVLDQIEKPIIEFLLAREK